LNDTIAPACAECVDSIFMLSFHFVLLHLVSGEQHLTLPPRESFKPSKLALTAA
jgi:hypothetical protein